MRIIVLDEDDVIDGRLYRAGQVARVPDGYVWGRTLKTPEQVAADERSIKERIKRLKAKKPKKPKKERHAGPE